MKSSTESESSAIYPVLCVGSSEEIRDTFSRFFALDVVQMIDQ